MLQIKRGWMGWIKDHIYDIYFIYPSKLTLVLVSKSSVFCAKTLMQLACYSQFDQNDVVFEFMTWSRRIAVNFGNLGKNGYYAVFLLQNIEHRLGSTLYLYHRFILPEHISLFVQSCTLCFLTEKLSWEFAF